MPEIPYNNRIIFVGECIDNMDPMGLGRITMNHTNLLLVIVT